MKEPASPRLDRPAELADYLIQLDRRQEARATLDRAVDDYVHAPRFAQRTDRAAYGKARQLLKILA